jgi:hypothetical protein
LTVSQLLDTPPGMPQSLAPEPRWLLLIHQIPPKPNYLRVKIGRRLQKLGAVAIKNSVYALPSSEQAQEDLNWVLREIVEGGGDGSIVEARFVEGLSEEQVREMFRAARDADYDEINKEARTLARDLPRRGAPSEDQRGALEPQLLRLQKRMAEIAALDFFAARSREPTDGLLQGLAQRLAPPAPATEQKEGSMESKPQGATWVTRTGIHVDRMASAWLIRRFIDEKARFKFVSPKEYQHKKGELRFDMFDGEFTHQGDLCTFEVLLGRFKLDDAALKRLAEVVHDIDLKDDKHARPEKVGIEHLINAIAMAHPEDEVRLARASAALDDLYELFKRKR